MRGRRHPVLRHLALAAVPAVLAVFVLTGCGDEAANPVPSLETLTPSATPSPTESTTGKRHDSTASARPVATPSASSSATPSSSSATRPSDKTIQGNILARLAAEAGLRGFSFKVLVSDRTVVIRGRVRTKEQKRLAEQICLTEPGVAKVVSAIDVSGAAGY